MGWHHDLELLVLEIKGRNHAGDVADIARRFEATRNLPARPPADIDQWFRRFHRGLRIDRLDPESRLLVRQLMTVVCMMLPPGQTRREAVEYIVTVLRRLEPLPPARHALGFRT
jgi:hypothetical protein